MFTGGGGLSSRRGGGVVGLGCMIVYKYILLFYFIFHE